MKATRQEVYAAIDGERDYQNQRWNKETTTSEGQHSLEEWVMYMENYLDEAKNIMSRQARQDSDPQVINILRKVTAMGVSAMEQHGVLHRINTLALKESVPQEVSTLAPAMQVVIKQESGKDEVAEAHLIVGDKVDKIA